MRERRKVLENRVGGEKNDGFVGTGAMKYKGSKRMMLGNELVRRVSLKNGGCEGAARQQSRRAPPRRVSRIQCLELI